MLKSLGIVMVCLALSFSSAVLLAEQEIDKSNNARAEADYVLNCQGCHLPDGSGVEGKVPSFDLLEHFLATPGGRKFLVQVPGTAQSQLSDAEIADVLNWMVKRFSPVVGFKRYDVEEIRQLRAARLVDVMATRKALVENFPE